MDGRTPSSRRHTFLVGRSEGPGSRATGPGPRTLEISGRARPGEEHTYAWGIRKRPRGRKIRYGMVGGGPGAFIGAVHRKAAAMDGEIELVAGAFSIVPEESVQMGAALHIDSTRVYRTWEEMLERERALPEG